MGFHIASGRPTIIHAAKQIAQIRSYRGLGPTTILLEPEVNKTRGLSHKRQFQKATRWSRKSEQRHSGLGSRILDLLNSSLKYYQGLDRRQIRRQAFHAILDSSDSGQDVVGYPALFFRYYRISKRGVCSRSACMTYKQCRPCDSTSNDSYFCPNGKSPFVFLLSGIRYRLASTRICFQ